MAHLEDTSLQNGFWSGLLESKTPPSITVTLMGEAIDETNVTKEDDETWRLTLKVPQYAISDGIHTFIIQNHGETIGNFSIVAGAPLAEDIREEISLLRAEFDMLKRAFRQKMRELDHG